MRAFDFAANQPWAITEDKLQLILDISQRQHEPDLLAVAQKQAEQADDAGILEMRGSIAIINVVGPIMRYATWFSAISGATSVQELATAFGQAVDDPAVKAIVLNVDSPGGEVAGISELAKAIYQARDKKLIVAYADDIVASGAYWIASAASRLVASDTARLGSIGVVATVVERARTDGATTYQFVSSGSPNKRPDFATDEGKATMQQMVDDLAAVFISAVARNRNVTEEKVLFDFGQGGILIASKAVSAGMADEIHTFEALLSDIEVSLRAQQATAFGGAAAQLKPKGVHSMDVSNLPPAAPAVAGADQRGVPAVAAPLDLTPIKKEAVASERLRIKAILTSPEAKGRENLALTTALETDLDAETAKKMLASAPVQSANPLAAAMAGVLNPSVGADAGAADDEASEIARIAAFAKKGKVA